MSIAEKLQIVAENQQKVYDAGYLKGKSEGGGTDVFQYATYNSGYTFRNAVFPDNYEANFIMQGFNGVVNMSYFCMNSNVYKAVVEFKEQPTQIATNSMFMQCSNLVEIKFNNTETVIYNGAAMCSLCSALERIEGVLNLSPATNISGMFSKCNALKEVRFAEGSIYKTISFVDNTELSNDTVDSIINGLADLTGQTSQGLTLHGNAYNKLTTEQEATIYSKNWTLAAVA